MGHLSHPMSIILLIFAILQIIDSHETMAESSRHYLWSSGHIVPCSLLSADISTTVLHGL